MAVALAAQASANTGTTSQPSVSVTIPSIVATGHLGILDISAERGLTPSQPAGWSQLASGATGTDMAHMLVWRALQTSDASTLVTSTVTTNRRMSATLSVWSGADVSAAPQTVADVMLQTSGTNMAHSSITPAVNDCVLLAVSSVMHQGDPWTTTVTPASGWTELLEEVTTSATSNNIISYQAYKALTGGSGVSQSGPTNVSSVASVKWWPSVLAIAPLIGPTSPAVFTLALTIGV